MTDEEKKAIDYFKADVEYLEEGLENLNYIGRFITMQDKEVKYLKTILNLIEKQEKEIELAKQSLIENADIADERNQLLVELQKKDKMIDLMAEKINNFRDELDMLRNFEKDCFIPREYSDINDCIKKESCKQCIIEYYSKKVGK